MRASVRMKAPQYIDKTGPGTPRPVFLCAGNFLLIQALVHRHGAGHGRAHHGVVAHAHETHHLNVGGHGGGTGELGVAVHTAHGVGQAVGSGAGRHVVRVQGAAGAAAGATEKYFLPFSMAHFL